jgi:hypothetical protein
MNQQASHGFFSACSCLGDNYTEYASKVKALNIKVADWTKHHCAFLLQFFKITKNTNRQRRRIKHYVVGNLTSEPNRKQKITPTQTFSFGKSSAPTVSSSSSSTSSNTMFLLRLKKMNHLQLLVWIRSFEYQCHTQLSRHQDYTKLMRKTVCTQSVVKKVRQRRR